MKGRSSTALLDSTISTVVETVKADVSARDVTVGTTVFAFPSTSIKYLLF
jgi:hypothetical protein